MGQLREILENVVEIRSYSGRCMYGKECVGFVTEDPNEDLKEIILHIIDNVDDKEEVCDLVDQVFKYSQDNMGLSTIIYYPFENVRG